MQATAILDVASRLKLTREDSVVAAKEELRPIVAMLVVLGKSVESRQP